MKPYFFISGGSSGGVIIDSLNDRFLSISIVDNAGFQNDRMSLSIDDRVKQGSGYIKLPVRGDKLTVQMGYQEGGPMYQPTDMMPMGTFIIDEIEVEMSPDTVHIHSHAVDTNGLFKQARSKSFHRTTIGKIVEDCAQYCGLPAGVHKDIKDIEITHEDQIMQSTAEFLRVFGERNDAIVKVVKGKILFGPKSKLHEIEGIKEIIRPKVELHKTDFLPGTARYTSQGKSKYAEVWAEYQTPDAKHTHGAYHIKIQDVIGADSADSSEGVVAPTAIYKVPGLFSDEKEAKAACISKMRMLALSECGFGFSCIGNPKITAESQIKIKGMRPGVMPTWNAIRVTHTLDNSGFKTSVECESPTKGTDETDTPAAPNE